MSEKLEIKVYKTMSQDRLTAEFISEGSCLETGSLSAASAASAAALLLRAAGLSDKPNDTVSYLSRNAEIIRNYMVHLIDEDVRCRAPLKRALREGGQAEFDACLQPAQAINAEIINMMKQLLELAASILPFCPESAKHYVREASELAFACVKISADYILDLIKPCTDDTFVYVTNRENEIFLEECRKLYEGIING